jgi:hypothetical protein
VSGEGEYQGNIGPAPDGSVGGSRPRLSIAMKPGRSIVAGIAECIAAQKIADQRLAAQYAVTRACRIRRVGRSHPKILQPSRGLGWDIDPLVDR